MSKEIQEISENRKNSQDQSLERLEKLEIANDLKTDSSMLAELAKDEDLEIVKAVAINPKTPEETLLELMRYHFSLIVTKNPMISLLSSENPDFIEQAFRNIESVSNTDKEYFESIMAKEIEDSNQIDSLVKEALFVTIPKCHLIDCILRNTGNIGILEKWYQKCHKQFFYADIASNPNTPIEILKELARHESRTGTIEWEVRKEVAGNPNTPVEILKELSRDRAVEVRLKAKESLKFQPTKPVYVKRKFLNSITY